MNPLIQLGTRIGARRLDLPSRRFFALASSIFLASAIITPSFADEFYTCKPVDVTVWTDHIHVRCDKPASGGIAFFAVPTASADPAHVARMLSVLLIARATGKNVQVEYNPADISGTDFGCDAIHCRRLISVGF